MVNKAEFEEFFSSNVNVINLPSELTVGELAAPTIAVICINPVPSGLMEYN
jgi:hypothetical protein